MLDGRIKKAEQCPVKPRKLSGPFFTELIGHETAVRSDTLFWIKIWINALIASIQSIGDRFSKSTSSSGSLGSCQVAIVAFKFLSL